MENPDYSVVVFYSTTGAIRAEKLTTQEGLRVKLIPIPRHLSSDCGVCLRCEWADVEKVRRILDGARVAYEEICAL